MRRLAAGRSAAVTTPMTATRAPVRPTTSSQPSIVTSVPRYSTPTPRRRRAAANASAPSSWRAPGGSPHHDRRRHRDAARLVGSGEAAGDRRAGRMLGRHAQGAGRPRVSQGRRRREEHVVDDPFVAPGGEDVIERRLGARRRRGLGGRHESPDQTGAVVGRGGDRRRSLPRCHRLRNDRCRGDRPRLACRCPARLDGHLAGGDRAGCLARQPAGPHQGPHRSQHLDRGVVVQAIARGRTGRPDLAVSTLPGPVQGGADARACGGFLDRVHGVYNHSRWADGAARSVFMPPRSPAPAHALEVALLVGPGPPELVRAGGSGSRRSGTPG